MKSNRLARLYRKGWHLSSRILGDSVTFSSWKKVGLLFGRFCIVLVFIVLSWTKGAGILSPSKFPLSSTFPWYRECTVTTVMSSPFYTSLAGFVRKCFSLQFLGHSLNPFGYSGCSLPQISPPSGRLSLRRDTGISVTPGPRHQATNVLSASVELCDMSFFLILSR